MQKKIIALAVAGLVSGAAFAQSNVTIYGFIDMNYTVANDSNIAGTKTYSGINAGGINGNRIGFKGEEDLGNGLTAKFHVDMAFQGDSGAAGQAYDGTGPLMRWSTVSLAGTSWGEIEAGRRDTPQDQMLGGFSANGRAMISQVSPVYVDTGRYDNAVFYTSPVWSGFQVKAAYSTQGAGQDQIPTVITSLAGNTAATTNKRIYALNALYTNGPLNLGVSYERNKLQDRSSTVAVDSYQAGNTWDIAGAYDFGVVKIDGAYGRINYAANQQATITELKDNRKQWTVGLSAPVGANGNVSLVYAHAKVDYISAATRDDKLSMWGLAYKHNLSKRTTAYAAYGKISQADDNQASTLVALSGTPANSSAYQQGFQVGLKHAF